MRGKIVIFNVILVALLMVNVTGCEKNEVNETKTSLNISKEDKEKNNNQSNEKNENENEDIGSGESSEKVEGSETEKNVVILKTDEPDNKIVKKESIIKKAILSEKDHSVSGVVFLIDNKTINLEKFSYDGKGPDVFVTLGKIGDNKKFKKVRTVGKKLTRAYNNETLTIELGNNVDLNNTNGISIYCDDYSVDFGSGSFK